MSLLSRAMGSITKGSDQPPTGPSNPGNRRQSGGGGANRASPYARPSGDSWKHDKFAESNSSTASNAAAPSSKAGGSLAARLSGNGASSVGQGQRSNKLVIKDLHYEVSERELELLFVQIGPIATGPKIKFDKSGRSTGLAWVSYTSEDHAAAAKQAFDGCPAKGQNIKVEYDYRTDRTVPTPGSLLARLDADPNAPRGPRNASAPIRGGRPHVGPQRGVGAVSDSRPPRNAPGGPRRGGGVERGVGGQGGGRGGKREPKTNDDLDKELEAFMKTPAAAEGGEKATPSTATTTTEAAPAADAAPQAESGGDVEMS
ncbi:hypothetical protein JCM5353_001450 [Sporobolomyces roseus]